MERSNESSLSGSVVITAAQAHHDQRRGTLQLLIARGIFFASAYVVAAILARALGPAEYGIYGVVISQVLWLEMIVAGVPAATAKLIADGTHDPQQVARSSHVFLIGLSGLLAAVGWVLAPAAAEFMRLPSGGALYRIAILDLPFAAMYASYEGILYGHQRFGVLAGAQTVYGLLRVGAVSALLLVGLSIQRTLLAIVLSTLGVCVFVARLYPTRGWLPTRATISEIARLAAVLEDRAVGMGTGADRLVAVDHPAAHAVQHLHLRHAVADRGRRALDPHVVGFGELGVGVDDLYGRFGFRPFQCGGAHLLLLCLRLA